LLNPKIKLVSIDGEFLDEAKCSYFRMLVDDVSFFYRTSKPIKLVTNNFSISVTGWFYVYFNKNKF
jgi:hypothetical protein